MIAVTIVIIGCLFLIQDAVMSKTTDSARLNNNGLGDQDYDGVMDWDDNCPNYTNPYQGDIDGDTIGDACDLEDLYREFTVEYGPDQEHTYDNVAGGGACNVDNCYGYQLNRIAYCPGVNYCVWKGDCYKGDASIAVDIDGYGPVHQAACVGYSWFDLDAGSTEGGLPGIEICELAGEWAQGVPEVGEYRWSFDGWGCCGDDQGEISDGDNCIGPVQKKLIK